MDSVIIQKHKVIIIGGGFGGLYTAQTLGNSNTEVTIIDKRNFHLFQPLLYQVATGGLSPGDIASPLRSVVNPYKNIKVIQAEVTAINVSKKTVTIEKESLEYDTLVIAAGAVQHYFGNDQWAKDAPGLKTIEDALEMRRRIFQAFENAEKETDPEKQKAWLTFVVVGGGATGVELAGALGELAHHTLRNDFKAFSPTDAEIILLEGGKEILTAYPQKLSGKAHRALEKLGVTIRKNTFVTDIQPEFVKTQFKGVAETIYTHTVLWGAGVKASGLATTIAKQTEVILDKMGRLPVNKTLNIAGHPEIYVIGDIAHTKDKNGEALPGVAPVAMQQGRYTGKAILARLKGKSPQPFKYVNKGNLAVIGRNRAIADLGFAQISGFPAWVIWVFVHIAYLVEFDNRLLVIFQWAYNYFTKKRGARLITGDTEKSIVLEKK